MPETKILSPEPKCMFVIEEHDDGTVVLTRQYRGSPNATSTRLMGLLATKVLSVVRDVMGLAG